MYHPLIYKEGQRVSYYFRNQETVLPSSFTSQLKNIFHIHIEDVLEEQL